MFKKIEYMFLAVAVLVFILVVVIGFYGFVTEKPESNQKPNFQPRSDNALQSDGSRNWTPEDGKDKG